jgi:hypothetical protein
MVILTGDGATSVIAFDVAGLPVAQLRFEVRTQVITSLVAGV